MRKKKITFQICIDKTDYFENILQKRMDFNERKTFNKSWWFVAVSTSDPFP